MKKNILWNDGKSLFFADLVSKSSQGNDLRDTKKQGRAKASDFSETGHDI